MIVDDSAVRKGAEGAGPKAEDKMEGDEEGKSGGEGAVADTLAVEAPATEEAVSNAGKGESEQDKEEHNGTNGIETRKYSLEGKLDLMLTYLWEVHLIDFYAGDITGLDA